MKAGLFSIGLDTYWAQFDGLLDKLNGYQNQIRARSGQISGAPLGIAAGRDHGGLRVQAPRPPHCAARIRIARPGDRAGIDDEDVGGLVARHDAVAAAVEAVHEGLGLVLIELAADIAHGDAHRGTPGARRALAMRPHFGRPHFGDGRRFLVTRCFQASLCF